MELVASAGMGDRDRGAAAKGADRMFPGVGADRKI